MWRPCHYLYITAVCSLQLVTSDSSAFPIGSAEPNSFWKFFIHISLPLLRWCHSWFVCLPPLPPLPLSSDQDEIREVWELEASVVFVVFLPRFDCPRSLWSNADVGFFTSIQTQNMKFDLKKEKRVEIAVSVSLPTFREICKFKQKTSFILVCWSPVS